jgi:D-alanyl-D-alanine carboxypeptidase (penicillin-binding protein 5/6)
MKEKAALRLIIFLCWIIPLTASAYESELPPAMQSSMPPPKLKAVSWVLMNPDTGVMIAAENPDEKMEPASLSKLLTAYIIFREIRRGNLSPEEEVVISENAWRTGGSRMFIEPGERISVENLLLGMIVQSGNDAAVALAEHVAGSEESFSGLLNQAVVELGLRNSHFVNSTGWPHPDHFSSARDISLITSAIIREFPDMYGYYSIREFTWNNITQHNRNPLLGRDESIDGVKTGHTEAAGYCLVGSAKRDGFRTVATVMGTESARYRAEAVYSLVKYGFAAYEIHRVYRSGAAVVNAVPVYKGDRSSVAVGVNQDVQLILPKGAGAGLEASVTVNEPLIAPLDQQQQVGNLILGLEGKEIGAYPLVTLDVVTQGSWTSRMLDVIRLRFR